MELKTVNHSLPATSPRPTTAHLRHQEVADSKPRSFEGIEAWSRVSYTSLSYSHRMELVSIRLPAASAARVARLPEAQDDRLRRSEAIDALDAPRQVRARDGEA